MLKLQQGRTGREGKAKTPNHLEMQGRRGRLAGRVSGRCLHKGWA